MPTATIEKRNLQSGFDLGSLLFHVFYGISLFLLIDPFYTGYGPFRVTRDIGPLKYFGLMAGLAAAYVCFVGMALRGPQRTAAWRQSVMVGWPVLAFGFLVLAGSTYARFHLGVHETFLQLGLGVLGFPIAVTLYWGIDRDHLVARRFLQGLTLVLPIVMVFVVWKRTEGGQAFHSEMFLFVPLAIYYFILLRRRMIAWLLLLACTAMAIFSFKNTAFLILLTVLLHLALIHFPSILRRSEPVARMVIWYLTFVTVLAAASAIAFLLVNREEYLPSGSTSVRFQTYGAAIQRFKDRPIVGNGFTETQQVDLEGQQILGVSTIATHSDFLDVLSHGGIVAVLLVCAGFSRALRRVVVAINRLDIKRYERALLHTLTSIVICGVVTASFNSPLVSIVVGMMFWFAFGLMVSIALHLSRQASNAAS